MPFVSLQITWRRSCCGCIEMYWKAHKHLLIHEYMHCSCMYQHTCINGNCVCYLHQQTSSTRTNIRPYVLSHFHSYSDYCFDIQFYSYFHSYSEKSDRNNTIDILSFCAEYLHQNFLFVTFFYSFFYSRLFLLNP